MRRGTIALAILTFALAVPARPALANTPDHDAAENAAQPLPPSVDSKLTVTLCRVPGQTAWDVNVRHAWDHATAWLGSFLGPRDVRQSRAGVELDLQRPGLLFVPSVQAATQRFLGASVYAEVGTRWFAILGAGRTNLRPYVNLTWDPNECWQFGGGRRLGAGEAVELFTIWDNRLHTGQQDTHLVVRRHTPAHDRWTVDLEYKSGHLDDGRFVRGEGATVTYDHRNWFARVAYDPYANFGPAAMWRLASGLRF